MRLVFSTVLSIRNQTSELTQTADPAAVLPGEAARVVTVLGEIERLAAAAKVIYARRAAQGEVWRRDGHRSPAHWLARLSGTSVGEAAALLGVADKLDDLAATDTAFRAGQLSGAQAREIADAASVDPTAEGDLLEAAETESLRELRDRARRARSAAEDENARHARIKKTRRLRAGLAADGAFELHYRDTPEAGADILAALHPRRDRIFREARAQGRREPLEAYLADALHALARNAAVPTPAGAGADQPDLGEGAGTDDRSGPTASVAAPRNAKIIVRIDHSALVRGHTIPGETCEIAGVGPVPVATVKAMMNDAFLAAIVTKGQAVATVAHLGRKVTAKQRTALEWRGLRCTVKGCPNTQFLEIDHLIDWATTQHTTLDELEWLCPHHHNLKTHHGYRLEPGAGPRRFLPPDQPDRPAARPPPRAGPTPDEPDALPLSA
jgi:hypothetical protein